MEIAFIVGGVLLVVVIVVLAVRLTRARSEAEACNIEVGRLRSRLSSLESENRKLKNDATTRDRMDTISTAIELGDGCGNSVLLFVVGLSGFGFLCYQYCT